MSPHERDALISAIEATLADERYRNFRELYGAVILERAIQAPTPACSIISLLADNVHYLLKEWEQRCARYLGAVASRADAIIKVKAELVGPARKSKPGQFNSVMGDFFAEMCAVGRLSINGYSEFVPVPTGRKKTPDYQCIVKSKRGCLEFKNIRAPQTILDTFSDLLKERLQTNAALASKKFALTYYCDNTVTDEQREEIDTYLTTFDASSCRDRELCLAGDVNLKVVFSEGAGTVMLTRGINAGEEPFVREDRLMDKIQGVVEKAVEQLRSFECEYRVLAMNIMTADMMLPQSWITAIRDIVYAKSAGEVHCELLLGYDSLLR